MAKTKMRKHRDTLSISVPPKLKEVINKLAWRDNRSVSNYIVNLITETLINEEGLKREDLA